MADESRYTASDVKIGLTVTVSVVLLMTLIAITTDLGRYFRAKRTVPVLFKHVVGLQKNSPVHYSGVEVGRVGGVAVITLDDDMIERIPPIFPQLLYELPIPDREVLERLRKTGEKEFDNEARLAIKGRDMVLLELEVDASAVSVLHEDDYVSVESTMMGDTSVEIGPGSGPVLDEDGILVGRSGSMFTRIGDAVDEIRYMMRTAGAALSGAKADFPGFFRKLQQAADNVVGTTEDLRKFSSSVSGIIEKTEGDVVLLAKRARSIGERTDGILEKFEGKAGPLVDNAAAVAKELKEGLQNFRPKSTRLINIAMSLGERLEELGGQVSELAAHALGAVEEGRADIRRATINVKDATKNFEEFTALVKKKPWLLLRAPRGADRELADALTQARMLLDTATRLDEAATKLAASRKPTDEETARLLLKAAEELKETADSVRRQTKDMLYQLKPLPLKEGGRGFEPDREPARYP